MATPITAEPANLTDATRASASADNAPPIVLDFGKHRRKSVKKLRQGTGKLMDDVQSALEELRLSGAIAARAQPIIVVVQRKRRRARGFLPRL